MSSFCRSALVGASLASMSVSLSAYLTAMHINSHSYLPKTITKKKY